MQKNQSFDLASDAIHFSPLSEVFEISFSFPLVNEM
jgi:hypothetical protein